MYGIFELWIEYTEYTDSSRDQYAQEALDEGLQNFNRFENDFIRQSSQLRAELQSQLFDSTLSNGYMQSLENEFSFWGTSVFRGQDLIYWSEFGAPALTHQLSESEPWPRVTVEQNNNVTFLSYQAPLIAPDADSIGEYQLVTRQKIDQENILSIGANSELSASELFQKETQYPLHFSFFEDPPEDLQFYVKLSTQSVDSVGIIYTFEDDFSQYRAANQNRYFLYRAIFYALLIIFISLFLISISQELSEWYSLLLKLFAITIAVIFFSNIEYGVGWIEIFYGLGQQELQAIQGLVLYSIYALFFLVGTIICFKPLLNEKLPVDKEKLPDHSLTAALLIFGLISVLILNFFLQQTHLLFIRSSIPILDLEVFPEWEAFFFYITSGIFCISILTLLTLIGWYLMNLVDHSSRISLLLMLGGFTAGLLMLLAIGVESGPETWYLFSVCFIFICCLSFIYMAHEHANFFTSGSRLRLMLLLSGITVCITYVATYKGYSERLDSQMQLAARMFLDEEATQAEKVARDLLTDLEISISDLTQEDLLQRPDFVENYFTQQTQRIIPEQWKSFSISTQLVNNNGKIIGEYSSDLDSPAWTRAFNMLSLVIPFEEEQIRVENLRPIVRERPLNEANSNYSSFRRAWIPLYEKDDNQTRIGWILCSVYRERPQFEKPLRAVIASENNDRWIAPIHITEYVNGKASRQNIVGTPLELPGYLRLPAELIQSIQKDSTLKRVEGLANQKVRELFIANADNQIIRAATAQPTFENHLFSMLRYFFSILVIGLLILFSLFWNRDLNLLGQNRRFRDRLIDRFIFASLLCLMALIGTTYYAVKIQNQKNVQDQLLNKLGNLTEAITLKEGNSKEASDIPLSDMTSTLDADASLYKNDMILLSTTSQIYNQHLLPKLLPWDVHESIFNRGNQQVTRKVTLGDQELLIGYQPWLNERAEIVGIVSIPTFLEAPKFNKQLLSTTSYLLGFYVVIFGFFILGAALISTQLTEPLEALNEGLKKISGGDLETTLPVKSMDEIGSLTNAYNVMVYRLKELQKDLAIAEREAAWKEMAQQVAHEIKNPLTPMKLNLQHLERQLNASKSDMNKLKPNIEKIAANMIGQIESLNKIASDFSKFAQPSEQEFSPVEINALLRSIQELYSADDQIQIRAELEHSELWVQGVQEELRRVLVNLVKNAHEAMPDGGLIILYSQTDPKNETVLISIEDTGEGIPEDSRDQIFVPNFSTKSSGTGLGLAITKKIVEEHSGEIHFSSTEGQGTRFTITLPIHEMKI